MSNKEKCMAIIDSIDDSQLANIAVMLQAAKQAIDEALDDAFCVQLYKKYQSDKDKGEFVSIEEAAQQLGFTL